MRENDGDRVGYGRIDRPTVWVSGQGPGGVERKDGVRRRFEGWGLEVTEGSVNPAGR